MFIYKAKVKANTERNIFKKFQTNMDNNFKKLEKIKRNIDGKQYEMGDKIIANINGLIKNLEKNE
jgi:hypothetical protein